MDVHDGETRSYNMSRIKGRDTKPEIRVRKACHSLGLRFRLQRRDLPGKPDLVFSKHQTVLFVHGCYWHSHECRFGRVVPKTNTDFWQSKRAATISRDERNIRELEYMGWRVLVYWECETRDIDAMIERLRQDFALQ